MSSPLLSEEAIFHLARKLEPGAVRQEYLRQACGENEAKRARIEALLEVHENENGFLSSPAGVIAISESAKEESAGNTIGPYKLLEQIGEGGFGLVFMAEQHHPVRRKVALKVLKPGMDSRQVIARFEAERQALALMDHPNIAKVLEAGETASGRPYFAMELVRGVPITDYCDRNALDTRARLDLMVTACQAVQHAHQKGIIHRDLKPTNVMVTLHDGIPVIKIIDFGIAKALGHQLTDKTLFTSFAQLVGTPLYMSPEQAELSGLDVDTRADVYSLAVMVYELLTGTTPFDRDRLIKVSYDELRRILRDEEPLRPSTRITTLGMAATPISAKRHSDPKGLSLLLRGELDWIVMKGLEKDRNRRYESAGALGRDLQRYLRDEPVSACPPSSWYRIRKFTRKNRWPLAVIGVAVIALVVITVGSLLSTIYLRQALRDSEQNRARAETAEDSSRAAATVAINAEKEANVRLYRSLRDQARASRFSRRTGQRFQALDALADAARVARDLNTFAEDQLDLRNEAIAAMALSDVRLSKKWDGFPSAGSQLDFDDNLERYAVCDQRGNVSVHRVDNNQELFSFRIPSGEAWPELSRDGRFLAVRQPNVQVNLWRLGGSKPEQILQRSDCGRWTAFSPDDRLFAFLNRSQVIEIYELASGERRWQLPVKEPVRQFAFRPHKPHLAVAVNRGVQIRNYETGESVANVLEQATAFETLAWHPDGEVLAGVSLIDWAIHLWDVSGQKTLDRLSGIHNGGNMLAFNHRGDLLASNNWERVMRLWDWRSHQQLVNNHTEYPSAPRFSQDDRRFAADCVGKELRLCEISAREDYLTLARDPALGPPEYQHGLAIDPTGRFLAAPLADGICFWDLESGQQQGFVALRQSTESVVFVNSGALLSYGASGLLRWPIVPTTVPTSASKDAVRLGPIERLPMPAAHYNMASSADGAVIASPRGANPAVVWRREQAKEFTRLPVKVDSRTIAVSPDGHWVATGRFGGRPPGACIWSIGDRGGGKLEKELDIGGVCSVAFSPDGKWLATVPASDDVDLWSVGFWSQPRYVIPSQAAATAELHSLTFSADSAILAIGLKSGSIRLIDVRNGHDLARLEDPNLDVATGLAFSPDGTMLAAASNSARTLHVWNLASLRRHLNDIGLDWELPSYPSPAQARDRKPSKTELEIISWPIEITSFVNQQKWDRARTAQDQAVEFEPDEPLYWFQSACLHLQANDIEGYRAICGRMFARFGKRSRAEELMFLAHAWALGPQASQDVAQVPKLAEERVAKTQPRGIDRIWSEHVLGLAYYRAGRFEEAIGRLDKSTRDNAAWEQIALNQFVLAMAHHKLGHVVEARQWLDKAVQGVTREENNRSEEDSRFAPPGWTWRDWVIAQLLLREAKSEIGGPSPNSREP